MFPVNFRWETIKLFNTFTISAQKTPERSPGFLIVNLSLANTPKTLKKSNLSRELRRTNRGPEICAKTSTFFPRAQTDADEEMPELG